MGQLYDSVRRVQDNLYDRSRGVFLAERQAFAEQMELMLKPLDSAMPSWHHDKVKSAVMIVLSRMVNDFEAGQHLLLRGLPEQAVHPIRDAIECMMVLRLFDSEPKMALRWMKDLKQYSAANCKALLEERTVEIPEYAYYAALSNLCHPNIFSSIAHVTEEHTEKGLIWTYHFGGMWDYKWAQLQFFNLLGVIQIALLTVLPGLYVPVLERPEEWYSKVQGMLPTLEKLGVEITEAGEQPGEADPRFLEKLTRPLRIHSRLLPELKAEVKVSSGLGLKRKGRRPGGSRSPGRS
jgi:hypothetical protein